MRGQLQDVLDTLDAREAAVVRMRYGLDGGQPKTLDEIGRAFKLSRERIRQIERETMAKLRHPSALAGAARLPRRLTGPTPETGPTVGVTRARPPAAVRPARGVPGRRRRT